MIEHLVRPLLLAATLMAMPARAQEGVVYTVNYPLQYFAAAIAGDDLEVVFPAPLDVDPAYWRPDTGTLLAYQAADLILLNGAGYAKWIADTPLPRSRLVDTSSAFRDRLIAETDDRTPHVHGPEGAHVHQAGTAFSTWLDLSLARAQADAVREAMAARWPDLAEGFAARHAKLDSQLVALDAALEKAAERYADQPLIASHPVYQYLARRYRLDISSLHWEPHIHPTDAEWQALEEVLARRRARVMLWEGQPTPETRRRLEALGIAIVVFPTLANRPQEGDFLAAMRLAVARLRDR